MSAGVQQVIEADLTWTGEAFEAGVRVAVGADGRIAGVGADAGAVTKRLTGRALIPGMINTHSHAFQRGLRGRGETFPAGAGDFWTWREAMYQLVDSLDPESAYTLSKRAFDEMLSAGITTVGEFHYIHHDASGAGHALDEAVIRAAADAGIRMVLLNTYYKTGAVGKPLKGGQLRFRMDSPREYWERMEALGGMIDARTQTLGAVAHSIRAAAIDDIVEIHCESKRQGMVFHMHIEEQRKEIEECFAGYGVSPMALFNERLEIDERFTAIHCTHTDPLEMERYLAAGATVCLCPTTEGNLGDGVPDIPGILASDGRIAIGFDSNVRICMTEELRWLEYVQRVEREQRGAVVDEAGANGRTLWAMATVNGAHALGLDAGAIRPGALADFATLDLGAPVLAGWTPETLLDSFIFGAGTASVAERCVGGRWL